MKAVEAPGRAYGVDHPIEQRATRQGFSEKEFAQLPTVESVKELSGEFTFAVPNCAIY
jgi:hypothetical protein